MIQITGNIENIFEGHETVRTKIEIVRTIKNVRTIQNFHCIYKNTIKNNSFFYFLLSRSSFALASRIAFSSAVPLICALTPKLEALALARGRLILRFARTFSARLRGPVWPAPVATCLETRLRATSSRCRASGSPSKAFSASAARSQHCLMSVLQPWRYAGPVYTYNSNQQPQE